MTSSDNFFLVAGLGNPGKEYVDTRHNIGFIVLNKFADKLNVKFTRMQSKAMVTKARHQGKTIVLAKPRSFMNNSGQPVSALARFYKIPTENILVVYDDVDLDFGIIRVRADGSSGGHKGMQSIIQQLGTNQIPRVRVGIGRPPGKMETPDYVLRRFSKQEEDFLPQMIETAADAALEFITNGVVSAMNTYNANSI